MRSKQLKLFNESKLIKHFGGQLLIGKRKSKRPLSVKAPIHLILRSNHILSARALSFRNKANQRILDSVAQRFGIQIYQSVFNFTHLHLVIRIPNRAAYVGFVRLLAAKLSNLAQLKSARLFTLRPFTRILSWGRDYKSILNYMNKNVVEAMGGIEIQWQKFQKEPITPI